MRILILVLAALGLTGCGIFSSVGAVECGSGQLNYCAAQVAAESKLNSQLDGLGSRTCVDLVHSCPFAQCQFLGCGMGDPEAGDWILVRLPDDPYINAD